MASIQSPGFPTPPASSAAYSQHASPLPQPRRHPLKPGGSKESELIRYLDHRINRVQKRVDNRMTNRKIKPAPGEEVGYSAFAEIAKDLDELLDVIWVSGSPNLQTPYLLNLAVLTAEFLPLFPHSDRSTQATFHLLSRLDEAFASLLTGRDPATGEGLPGFEHGRAISTTDKVRMKGIVDRTRLTVVKVLSVDSVVGDDSDAGEPMETDMEGEESRRKDTVRFEGFENDDDEDDEDEERRIGSVYEKTIGELGDVLGGTPIGIITEDWKPDGADQQRSAQGFVESEDEVEL
ncbi:hypothetical protein EK21DRAFT_109419 [Setomelanomma holmii]|uniref:Uncharacterized protein n=1 Tax=Setomelanomma holmii TaxID=210430 RepID=A0A9P4HG31_9PLEO|nr:hypothetical protein EK21DRAFT_109419 [Setomelanomma holmii]